MNKRGISAIVATVLIVLITVAGVAIIWVAIIPMVNENADFESFDVRFSIITSSGYTVYDPDSGLLSVQVKRGPDTNQEINYIELIVVVGGNSEKFTKLPIPGSNQAKTYYLSVSGSPESVSVAGIVGRGENRLESKPITSELDNLPDGDIDKDELVDEGTLIYLSGKANVSSQICKDVTNDGYVNSILGKSCSLGECDGSGGCFECVQDSCDDDNVCTVDSCGGNSCLYTVITSCGVDGGCCPAGCNANNDGDCLPVSGNDIAEGDEECDGSDLREKSCESLGYYSGTLSCNALELDTSGCVLCGDEDVTSYCENAGGDLNDGEWITRLTFGGIDNPSAADGYLDASHIISDQLVRGSSYTIDVEESISGYEECFSVWIDWNHNEVFDDNERTYVGCGEDEVVSGTISTPSDALLGSTLMRIVGAYSSYPSGACTAPYYNEVEDYTICVAP